MLGEDDGVEPRHVGPILRPLGAIDAADRHDLDVVLPILPAGERWGRSREKVRGLADSERRHVAPVEEDSDLSSIDRRATRRGLPYPRPRHAGHEELGGRRAVVGAQQDHGRRRRFTRRDAIVLGLAVRYRQERARTGGVESARAGREIVPEHRVCRRNGRGLGRCARGRVDGSEVRPIPARHRVDRFEHGELRDRHEPRLRERVRGGGLTEHRGHCDRVPVQDDIGGCDNRTEQQANHGEGGGSSPDHHRHRHHLRRTSNGSARRPMDGQRFCDHGICPLL